MAGAFGYWRETGKFLSFRAPSVQSLIARPGLSTRYPAPGANPATSPDRVAAVASARGDVTRGTCAG